VIYLVPEGYDITERKQAVEALQESEERLEKINECFLRFGTDSNENINRLTALCGELLGATCALYNRLDGEMLCSWGQWNTPIDYNPVDTPDGHICYDVIKSAGDKIFVITNLPDTHYAQTDPNVIPYKLKTYLGRAVKLRDAYVGSLCVVYQDDIVPDEADKRVIEIIASAIGVEEERKRAEQALRESEEKLARSRKMESLGLLAGGVAHDLNNVLSGIVSYPELIIMDLPEDSKLRKPIETMQESGHRAAAIVQDLLTVARGVATTKEPLNLNELIGDYLNSPEFKKLEQFHPTVTVKTNLDTDLFNIGGSHVHIRKVIMNLVSNASEAIDSSGNVTISTMNRYIDRPLRGYDDVSIGEYVVLAVSDDGSGISSDDLERIFDPFYTKKVMGRSGTGLGLAVVWNVVQDHKGYIDVTTDENGTTFELYFPITREEISSQDLSIPIKDYKGNGETILVVDDVGSQRDISCRMLDKLGYITKAESSGEEAVEYLKENTVDLIVLDMIMDPGINGLLTYERILKTHPNQKAIIVSGFAETDDVKEAQRLGAGQYVKKPITLEKIGIAIRDELKK
jgi:signal transduction histidine kinase